LRSTSKKPFCPITRPLHPPMTAHGHRVRFVATWREEFFEVPQSHFRHLCRSSKASLFPRRKGWMARLKEGELRGPSSSLCLLRNKETLRTDGSHLVWAVNPSMCLSRAIFSAMERHAR